jgi:hypothetical protein
MSKYWASEMCVRVANDALQVLGGSGYMTDYPLERHLRDARITTIYEGTSQMQIVAAVRGVCGGAFEKHVVQLEQREYFDDSEGPALNDLKQKLVEGKNRVLEGVAFVKERGVDYMDLYGRKLVDSATAVLIGHLLLRQATAAVPGATGGLSASGHANKRKRLVAQRFIEQSLATLQRDMALLRSGDRSVLTEYETLVGPPGMGA